MSWYTLKQDVPFITSAQMREVDRVMVETYGIQIVQMMENAGRSLARLARDRFLAGDPRGRRVLVLAGTGGNGGGGLVCARRLHNWGADVHIWLSKMASHLTDVTHGQLHALEQIRVPIEVAAEEADLSQGDLVVDALIGYSLHGAPTGAAATLIHASNRHGGPVLALDVPSGVDATTGAVHDPAIFATATLTLALPKQGLCSQAAREHVGELYLGDIGVPQDLFTDEPLELEVGAIFAEDDIVRVW